MGVDVFELFLGLGIGRGTGPALRGAAAAVPAAGASTRRGTSGACGAVAVCLSGPDGVGKSTVAKAVELELARRGVKARRAWMRGTHTAASLLARLLSRLGAAKGAGNPYYGIDPARLGYGWMLLEVASAAPVMFARYILPRTLGYAVVGDRGPLDLAVWLAATAGDASLPWRALGRIALAAAARVCRHYYIYAEPREAARRARGPAPDYALQFALYDALAAQGLAERVRNSRPDEAAKAVVENACTRR